MKYLLPLAILLAGCVHVSQPNDEAHYECAVIKHKPTSQVYKMLPCADAAAATTAKVKVSGTWCQTTIYSGKPRAGFYGRVVDCETWDDAPGTPFIDIRPK